MTVSPTATVSTGAGAAVLLAAGRGAQTARPDRALFQSKNACFSLVCCCRTCASRRRGAARRRVRRRPFPSSCPTCSRAPHINTPTRAGPCEGVRLRQGRAPPVALPGQLHHRRLGLVRRLPDPPRATVRPALDRQFCPGGLELLDHLRRPPGGGSGLFSAPLGLPRPVRSIGKLCVST